MIQDPTGTLLVLAGIVALFFFLEQQFRWKIFQYLPPLLWIYMIPVVLGNTDVIPQSSSLYDGLKSIALPILKRRLRLPDRMPRCFLIESAVRCSARTT